MDTKVKYWVDLAEYDLDTAEAMLAAKRYLYVGFMCHQAIEKAFKAAISNNANVYPPKIHNLQRLARIAEVFPLLSSEQKGLMAQLEPLNIQARYPEYKDELFQSLQGAYSKSLLAETKELLQWIIQTL